MGYCTRSGRRFPSRPLRAAGLLTLVVVECLLAGAFVAAVPAGSAAPVWSRVKVPSKRAGFLRGLSCPTAANCWAVGGEAAHGTTYVEHWTGKSWTIGSSPTPRTTGSPFAALSGVSCPSGTSCYAVGDYQAGSPTTLKTLVEHWNGRNWSIMTSPSPPGATNASLAGVSCPSAGSCYAIGYTNNKGESATLVERWNGANWSIVPSPNPVVPTHGDIELHAISCTTTTDCTAVGNGYGEALVEHWDGATWSIVPSPKPANSLGVFLYGVSCTSTANCTAVGDAFIESGTSGNYKTLIVHWDGINWSISTSPNAPGQSRNDLSGVSCPSATSCFAVGEDGGYPRTLIEHWNGKTWSIMTSHPSAIVRGLLNGVSCPRPTSCNAVGSDGSASALAERYT